jgi:hypothetical protein
MKSMAFQTYSLIGFNFSFNFNHLFHPDISSILVWLTCATFNKMLAPPSAKWLPEQIVHSCYITASVCSSRS